MVALLPFGDRAVIVTVTGDQLAAALRNGFKPACDQAFEGGTGRFPQLSGLKAQFHCDGSVPVIDGLWRTPDRAGEPDVAVGPTDTIRLVTVDYLLAGGDGYSMLAAGRDIREPGDALLDIAMDDLATRSPVAPAVEDRIVGP
jgi:2',3'-cyclic-nucleotide 2'-phosphodiesterase (5'-nucleotidase family)